MLVLEELHLLQQFENCFSLCHNICHQRETKCCVTVLKDYTQGFQTCILFSLTVFIPAYILFPLGTPCVSKKESESTNSKQQFRRKNGPAETTAMSSWTFLLKLLCFTITGIVRLHLKAHQSIKGINLR